jgi:hypothetical protein
MASIIAVASGSGENQLSEERDTESALKTHGVDICELPTFGTVGAPSSTIEVWSWDDDHLLVGCGKFTEWEIVPR